MKTIPTISNRVKRLFAREWIIFVCLLPIGSLYTVFAWFPPSTTYQENRQKLYKQLTKPPTAPDVESSAKPWEKYGGTTYMQKKKPMSLSDYMQKKRGRFDDILDDSTERQIGLSDSLGHFDDFSVMLDDPSRRRLFFHSYSNRIGSRSYKDFENTIIQRPWYEHAGLFFWSLFAKDSWLQTWFSVSLPYLALLFFRSIWWSVKTVRRNPMLKDEHQ